MFNSATHLMFCQSFSITDELLTLLRCKIGTQGVLESRVQMKGWHDLGTRCNYKTYSMFIVATHLISGPNFSVTVELMTYFLGLNGCIGVL